MKTRKFTDLTIFENDPDTGADYDPAADCYGEIAYSPDSSAILYGVAWIDPYDTDRDLDLDCDYMIGCGTPRSFPYATDLDQDSDDHLWADLDQDLGLI